MLFGVTGSAKQGVSLGRLRCRRFEDRRFLTRILISAPADGLFRFVQSDIQRVLFDGTAIHKRIDEIAAQITTDYSDRELVVIAF